VQTLFNISGVLMVLSGVGFVGSMALETLAGKHVFTVSNGELTVTASGIDRILLSIFAITAILTMAAAAGLRQRR